MKKFMEYLLHLGQDDTSRYPGVFKKSRDYKNIPESVLWSGYSLFHDTNDEARYLDLRNI